MTGNRKREIFAKHAPDEMVAMESISCARRGCLEQFSYGIAGSRQREFCAVHAVDGMVGIISATCHRKGCSEIASYGVKGSNRAELCFTHAIDGMVAAPVARKGTCLRAGCPRAPSNGLRAGWRAALCVEHATVKQPSKKNCRREGRFKSPCFGVAGSKKPEYCASYRLDGMVNVCRTRCRSEGCMKTPVYGFAGVQRNRVCAKQAVAGMIPLYRRRCANNCSKTHRFGDKDSGSRVFCAEHILKGMVKTVVIQECAQESYRKAPTHGMVGAKKGVVCAEHAAKRNGQRRHQEVFPPGLLQDA